jgi:hypothetical protein
MFMCRKHWFSLSASLRKGVMAAYRPGQCDDLNISQEYADVATKSVVFLAQKEGLPHDPSHPKLVLYRALRPE